MIYKSFKNESEFDVRNDFYPDADICSKIKEVSCIKRVLICLWNQTDVATW